MSASTPTLSSISDNFSRMHVSSSSRGVLKRVKNVHEDDIHAITRLGNTLLTGSKDGCVKKWSLRGDPLWTLANRNEGEKIDYRRWVTALTSIGKDRFAFGTRDGFYAECDAEGTVLSSGELDALTGNASKDRNAQRISCLTSIQLQNREQLFIGQASRFVRVNLHSSGPYAYIPASQNDWVYCIHAMNQNPRRMLIVTGTTLTSWNYQNGRWSSGARLWEDRRRFENGHRPYISSVAEVAGVSDALAMSLFDGAVRVIDKEQTTKSLHHFQEHQGRVWMVISPEPHMLISSADDGFVKVWDIRQRQSVKQYGPYIGRVSSILSTEEKVIVAGTCPSRPTRENCAELLFIDLRA